MSCGVTDLEKLARTGQLLTGSRLHFSGVQLRDWGLD